MLRTVAEDTPSPAAVTSSDDATGSPDAMYSRTSAANTRFDLSVVSCDIYGWQSALKTAKDYTSVAVAAGLVRWRARRSRLLSPSRGYTPARANRSRAASRAAALTPARSTRTGA